MDVSSLAKIQNGKRESESSLKLKQGVLLTLRVRRSHVAQHTGISYEIGSITVPLFVAC